MTRMPTDLVSVKISPIRAIRVRFKLNSKTMEIK
ncbi:Uncharacterised protein [uncultured archaeon]|nr:Uncharacterised protein [uncultured archaeon]